MSRRPRRSTLSPLPRAELRGPLLAGLVALLGSWLFLSLLPELHFWLRGDVAFYENWGSWLAIHRIPYRDFAFEYPPGALPVVALPWYLRKVFLYHGGYDVWFRVVMLAIAAFALLAMAFVLARLRVSRRRAYAALVLAGLAPLLLGPIAVSRYDYWPALLAVVGIAALLSGRGVLACALFAAGAVAKMWPVLLAPFALVELWRRGRWRGVGTGIAAGAVVLAAGFGPFLGLGPHGMAWAIHRQLSRPLQVESLGSALLVAAHELAGFHLHVTKGSGSDNLVGAWPDRLGTLSGIATVLALLLVYALYARGRSSPERLVTACAAAMVAYIALAKVFSPQYLVWLIPIVPLVGGRAGLRANALFAGLLGLTQIWEPYRYHQYYATFAPWLAWLVVVRDLLMLVLLWLLLRPLLGSERDPEQLDPGRASVVGAVDDDALDPHAALGGLEADG
jgi:Glycosyltransferase family 87